MGNVLRLLYTDPNCCSVPQVDVFVDFENAQPSQDELGLYNEAEKILENSLDILSQLENYHGASKEISEAIKKPGPETEAAAWERLVPNVETLQKLFAFSKDIDDIVRKILLHLSSVTAEKNGEKENSHTSKYQVEETMEHSQAVVKQLAKVLDFVLKFDECKMNTPAIQNDFSYYRRFIQKTATKGDEAKEFVDVVSVDEANKISLFFAYGTPMLSSLSQQLGTFINESNSVTAQRATNILGMMASVCQKMLEISELKERIRKKETELFVVRVLVATIILYDHVHPAGAFIKNSSIDIRGSVKVIRDQESSNGLSTENLMNALRYTTKHVNDDTTPKSIKSVLFESTS